MDLDDARSFLAEHHRAVLATRRASGATQMSPVLCALDDHGRVVVSTRETARKTHQVRRDPRVALCVLPDEFFGRWIQVEGRAEVIELPEAMEGLVEYYRRVSGEHPDWDAYRKAMFDERRVLLAVTLERAGPDLQG
jgi:PPOX class probable F420-dependent enzyme